MDTNAESSMRNEVVEYVKQYAMITLSISIMSVGVYFFKFPNNFVFGGVTGMGRWRPSSPRCRLRPFPRRPT